MRGRKSRIKQKKVLKVKQHYARKRNARLGNERKKGQISPENKNTRPSSRPKKRTYFIPEYLKITASNKGENRDRVLSFLQNFEASIADGIQVHLDFSKVILLFPCGALLLYAAVERATSNGSHIKIKGFQRNNRTHQVLQKIGFLDLIDSKLPKTKIERDDVKCWHMQEVSHGESNRGARVKAFLEATEKVNQIPKFPKKLAGRIYGAIDEAVQNMETHAYDMEHTGRKGWILWSYSVDDGQFSIWAYDDGVGIPTHIKRNKHFMEWVKSKKSIFISADGGSDSFWIEQSVRQHRSATELSNRGTGLPQIVNVALHNRGSVSILSGRGQYQKSSSSTWDEQMKYSGHRKIKMNLHIRGTIIAWRFLLNDQIQS